MSLVIEGGLLWRIKHHKETTNRVTSISNIKKSYFIDLAIQFVIVLVLFILIAIKEINQMFYSVRPYYEFLKGILKNEDLAVILSYVDVPIINVGNFLLVSTVWIAYNTTQLLLDRRIRKHS